MSHRSKWIICPDLSTYKTVPKTNEIFSGYRESGYLPKAVINFLALLGWNPGGEKELFEIEELIELFSMDRISRTTQIQ
jgi:glutamyl-tRNA synthetase